MEFKQIIEWTPLIGLLLAAVGGGIALVTYRGNVLLKRAEWLDKLYTKFFESANYKRMRRFLDYRPAPDYANLQQALSRDGVDDELCESLVDYLNFFEYVSSLWKIGQLREDEIRMLFEYYVRDLRKHEFVWQFICGEGFEHLEELVTRLPQHQKKG
jgi:hypothetical protein